MRLCHSVPGLLICTALNASAFGQDLDAPIAPDDGSAGSSYVNTNFEAQEALSRAEGLVALGKWSAAAAAFQSVGDSFGTSIERIDRCRFISIRDHVNRRIAGWPADGIAAYREAFEGRAAEALRRAQQGREIEALVGVGERFYATGPGAAALDAAAELAIERGDFASARQWYARLLADHPERDRLGDQWRVKASLCSAWAGDSAALRAISDELPPDQPGPSVAWGGREQPLGEFVRAVLSDDDTFKRVITVAARSSMLGGGPDRRGFFESNATAEAVLWRFSSFDSRPRNLGDVHEPDSLRSESAMRELQSGRRLSMSPVAGGGLIFVHNHRTVWAIDAESPDSAAWRYDLVDGPLQQPRWLSEEELPPLSTSTWSDGRLYVHLDREPPSSIDGRVGESSVLVCLDAKHGRELWRNEMKGFASKFEETRIDGAPLVHQGRLFAVVRRRKPFGFEACFLHRFDMQTGQLVWSAHVGEAATGSYGYRRATLSHPAAEGDRIFVQTNLGTVAAVSATTGRIAWLRRYKSKFADGAEGHWPSRLGEQMRSWQYQPTVLWQDRVLCMPLDMTSILVLDQNDGREIRRIPLSRLYAPQYILGVHGDLLYTVGTQVTGYDLRADQPAWTRPLAEGRPFGRGIVTSSGLFIPTTHGLLRYPLDGGAAGVYAWSLESAGNLIALPDQIVVASSGSVFGLVGMENAF
ncbi:MAG: PQQ-binding-like beta-propeller repeat protein, partial [Planctomycetota bacterium]|nr:PQQ-binding-like beta-propeller repeat protein [Planctomycetota bacterium]